MRQVKILLLFLVSVTLTSCLVDEERNRQLAGGGTDETNTDTDSVMVDSTGEEVVIIEEEDKEEIDTSPIRRVIARRRNNGDTQVLPGAKLRRLIPGEYRGFKAGDIMAERINLKERKIVMSFVNFKMRKSGQLIEGRITDLNGAPDKLIQNWKEHNRELDYRSNREFNVSYRPSDWMFGYENILRNQNEAIVSVLVYNRFVVGLHGFGFKKRRLSQRFAPIKDAAQSIKEYRMQAYSV